MVLFVESGQLLESGPLLESVAPTKIENYLAYYNNIEGLSQTL